MRSIKGVAHRKGPATAVLAGEYIAGATTTELGAKYAMTPAAVNRRLARAGVRLRPARVRALYDDAAVLTRIVAEYRSGSPMVDIAPNLGVSHSTVQRALAAAGVRTRPNGLRRRTVRVPDSPEKLGYLAGMLDGEGNLQFKSKHEGRSIACKMAIYSTTPAVMQWLVREVGGRVRWDTKRTERKGWLPIGIWSVYRAHDVAVLLRALEPLLLIKGKDARAALRLFAQKFEIHDSPPTITQSSPMAGSQP